MTVQHCPCHQLNQLPSRAGVAAGFLQTPLEVLLVLLKHLLECLALVPFKGHHRLWSAAAVEPATKVEAKVSMADIGRMVDLVLLCKDLELGQCPLLDLLHEVVRVGGTSHVAVGHPVALHQGSQLHRCETVWRVHPEREEVLRTLGLGARTGCFDRHGQLRIQRTSGLAHVGRLRRRRRQRY